MRLFVVGACILLTGCFLDHEQVEYRTKACNSEGGKAYIFTNRDGRALDVGCNIGGIKYYVDDKGRIY